MTRSSHALRAFAVFALLVVPSIALAHAVGTSADTASKTPVSSTLIVDKTAVPVTVSHTSLYISLVALAFALTALGIALRPRGVDVRP